VRQQGVEFEVRLTEAGTNQVAVNDLLIRYGRTDAEAAAFLAKLPGKVRGGLTPQQAQALAEPFSKAGARIEIILIPLGPDITRGWGQRLTVAQDYLRDHPVLIGSQRLGADLANIGVRETNAARHLLHLYNPRLTVADSMMPRYEYLFEKRTLKPGEPRSGEALPLGDAAPDGIEVVPKPEAHALVAYLLSLRAETPLFEAPAPKPKGAGAITDAGTNAPPPAP
jgi:hypothetical protein